MNALKPDSLGHLSGTGEHTRRVSKPFSTQEPKTLGISLHLFERYGFDWTEYKQRLRDAALRFQIPKLLRDGWRADSIEEADRLEFSITHQPAS